MESIEPGFLQKLRGKSILLYLSSCCFKTKFLKLPYEYIILNSKSFGTRGKEQQMRLAGDKLILMPFDNEYCIRLMIDAGLKISLFVGIQDGCCEGGNHECINSQTFFSRLSPLIADECHYLTNHLFPLRKPVENRLPFEFQDVPLDWLEFNPGCFSNYGELSTSWRLFRVKRAPRDSVSYMIGKAEVQVHHASL